ncbi:MAG: hypothetical protein IKM48_08710 [Clostridia bacterium]|nr:hypothetical protein [Clostridia bacterium]
MSFANFKPTIWAKVIETELKQKCILVDHCNQNFEGEPKYGNRVKIVGAVAPEVFDYIQTEGLGEPQIPDAFDAYIDIDQQKAYNFMVDDIDKAQINPNFQSVYLAEAAYKMAAARDKYVASLAAKAPEGQIIGGEAITTTKAAKALIDEALLKLREADVDYSQNVRIEVSHKFYQLFRDALVELKTNNDSLIAKGIVGMYDNCKVVNTNHLHNDGTDTYMMVRTNKAIGFASCLDETEAYRSHKYFSDVLRGLNVFGANIVRPKELVVVKFH